MAARHIPRLGCEKISWRRLRGGREDRECQRDSAARNLNQHGAFPMTDPSEPLK